VLECDGFIMAKIVRSPTT